MSVRGRVSRKSSSWLQREEEREDQYGDVAWELSTHWDRLGKTRCDEQSSKLVVGTEGRKRREQTAAANVNDCHHKKSTNFFQSGLTPKRLQRSSRPTPDLVSESSSRMVTCTLALAANSSAHLLGREIFRADLCSALSSQPSSTPEHELGSTPLPSDSVDTLVSVRGGVPLRPVCLPRLCGSGGCEFSGDC